MSAATMLALGADAVVMGRKGELGPIDPQLSIQRGGDGGTVVQEQVAVEDIMSYVRFLREKAGLSDQSALVQPISALVTKLDPWVLGKLNRAHSHIRSVARKLLTARTKQQPLDEQRIQVIVETLAERTYQHGHAIGRREAKEIGLNVVHATDREEELMWALYEAYEDLLHLRDPPVDLEQLLPADRDERTEPVPLGCIESRALAHHFGAEMKMRRRRRDPPQLVINLNLAVNLPAGLPPEQLPPALQRAIQQALADLQQRAAAIVQEEVRRQAPVLGYEGRLSNGAWRRAEWPAT
jgi:hypothetical protein